MRSSFDSGSYSSGNLSWAALSRNEWLRRVRKRLSVLAELPSGWDGYGAPKIPAETVLFAAQVLQDIWCRRLDTPDISAMSNSGLMLEIMRNDFELTIEITGPYSTSYIFERPGGTEENGLLGSDLSDLRQHIEEMLAADPAPAMAA